jgi:hypothetical protein
MWPGSMPRAQRFCRAFGGCNEHKPEFHSVVRSHPLFSFFRLSEYLSLGCVLLIITSGDKDYPELNARQRSFTYYSGVAAEGLRPNCYSRGYKQQKWRTR